MKKTYAVIGLGRFGTAVAERLYALGNEVLVIDDDAERVQRMESRVTSAVVAAARDEAVLRSLGMRNYDCAIVAIGSDLAASIVITMNLKELGVPQGSVILPELFSGCGPNLAVRVLAVRTSDAVFHNEFTAAGINQTLHRITIDINVTITILTLAGTQDVEVDSSVIAAETVIVGQVPTTYIDMEELP